MQMFVQITFRGMDASPAMESLLREKLEPLAQIESRATSCHVTVEPTDRRHRHGTIHRFTIRLAMPGDELVVSREAGANQAHEDPYVGLRDACDAMRRQLVERHAAAAQQRRNANARR